MSFLFLVSVVLFPVRSQCVFFFLPSNHFARQNLCRTHVFGVRPTDSAHRQKKIIAKTIIRICPFRQILSCSNLPTSSVKLIWPITELYFRQILSTDFMNRFCQDAKTGPKGVEEPLRGLIRVLCTGIIPNFLSFTLCNWQFVVVSFCIENALYLYVLFLDGVFYHAITGWILTSSAYVCMRN